MRTLDELDDVLIDEYYFESSLKDYNISIEEYYHQSSLQGDGNALEQANEISCALGVAGFQSQGAQWCLKSKEKLCSDSLPIETPDGYFILLVKDRINSYMNNPINRTNQAMKWLYTSTDIELLSQQISILALHFQLKNYSDISVIDEHTQLDSLDPVTVSMGIAIYTYYTLLVNSAIKINSFNELFLKSWHCYYNNYIDRCLMIRMNGTNWRQQFKGVLLE